MFWSDISGTISYSYYALLAQDLQRLRPGEREFVEGTNFVNAQGLIRDTASRILGALGEHRKDFALRVEETTDSVPTYWELSVERKAS